MALDRRFYYGKMHSLDIQYIYICWAGEFSKKNELDAISMINTANGGHNQTRRRLCISLSIATFIDDAEGNMGFPKKNLLLPRNAIQVRKLCSISILMAFNFHSKLQWKSN